MKNKFILARQLRKNSTKEERKLWNILRNRQFLNLKFKRQFPIGDYIADFVCEEKKIIIELDGGQHNEDINKQKDAERTQFIESQGYCVYRFWNNDINQNFEGIYNKLLEICS